MIIVPSTPLRIVLDFSVYREIMQKASTLSMRCLYNSFELGLIRLVSRMDVKIEIFGYFDSDLVDESS